MKGPSPRDPLDRFLEKVEITDDCWLWLGSCNNMGYGRFSVSHDKAIYAHRWVYETLVGPIPEGLVIDHLCSVPNCVHLDHLEAVTQQENLRRGHVRRGTARAFRPHGTVARYTGGCICSDCRAANAQQQQDRRVRLAMS